MNSIITRFAPSPTGNLHLGSVRTALINYILTKQSKIKYPDSKLLLRIEDTDKERSTKKYQENIIENLNWLGIDFDEEPYIQSLKVKRHQEIALELINKGKAFKCICTPEVLEKRREENRINKNLNKRLCISCKDNHKIQSLKSNYAVRINVPLEGETIVHDFIQGRIKVLNKEIDDFILLRKDGTPTYMLSVVVDDFDMNVNLIIRGDDHLNNTFRQLQIYKNLKWQIPNYSHLPLIHGEDGKKLSKRHGAVNIQEFRNNGYLKESIINNLILLGWSPNKKEEIIQIEEIIKLFDISKISKSSSIFSYDKLNFFNNNYIKKEENFDKFIYYCKNNLILKNNLISDKQKFLKIFQVYKNKIFYYKEMEDICSVYFKKDFNTLINNLFNKDFNILIKEFYEILCNIDNWENDTLEKIIKDFILVKKIKFIIFGKPLRLLLINSENGPSISEIFFILGKKNSIERIKNYIININYG